MSNEEIKETVEEKVENATQDGTAEDKFATMVIGQINTISHMVKEYFSVINPNGKLSGFELTLLGLNMMQAGLLVINDGANLDGEDVPSRINTFANIKRSINTIIDGTYLNEETVAKMVALNKADELDKEIKKA